VGTSIHPSGSASSAVAPHLDRTSRLSDHPSTEYFSFLAARVRARQLGFFFFFLSNRRERSPSSGVCSIIYGNPAE
jgi:hypothetical protein